MESEAVTAIAGSSAWFDRGFVTDSNAAKQELTEWLKEIRDNINKGLSLGNKRFTTQIEALTNRRVTAKKASRPRKIKDNINNNQLMLL
jgi:hypothetical protein